MQIDEKTIEEFQQIYFEEFGERIDKDTAYDKFLRLINLLRVLTKKPADAGQEFESSNSPSFENNNFKE